MGDHIAESSIANELNISRTPVRRAIARLEAEQLVEIKVNRGATVIESSMSLNHFISLLEMVEMLTIQTITKMENKRLPFYDAPFREKLTQLVEYSNKRQDEKYVKALFDYLFEFVRLMQNSYANRWIQVIESDFDLKAQKEIKVLPLLLANETNHELGEILTALTESNYEAAKTKVKDIINKFIVQTFR
ncbi:GntR family transcriptional regulator [Listeria floridensis]|uniref:GntR family transcriptional regulator n=1 Tax=Listeria floridensis TaxID=1494962 RepID=UPI0004AD9FAA|nr:GntR family transcriptional regulator [Listeria floridensis]